MCGGLCGVHLTLLCPLLVFGTLGEKLSRHEEGLLFDLNRGSLEPTLRVSVTEASLFLPPAKKRSLLFFLVCKEAVCSKACLPLRFRGTCFFVQAFPSGGGGGGGRGGGGYSPQLLEMAFTDVSEDSAIVFMGSLTGWKCGVDGQVELPGFFFCRTVPLL